MGSTGRPGAGWPLTRGADTPAGAAAAAARYDPVSRQGPRTAVAGTPPPTRDIPRAGAGDLSTLDTTESRGLALAAAAAAADKKATGIRILDLGELLGITDFFVILSVGNDRQLGTVADEIEHRLKQGGRAPRRREGTKATGWMILDYGDVVVHAFTAEQRSYYDLERLWSDAPTVPFDELAAVEAAQD